MSASSAPTGSENRPKVLPQLATLGLLAALAIALLASVPGLRGVVRQIWHINPIWLGLAILLELASDVSFVILFRRFFDRLPGRDARALAWTEQATGALLPGGGAGGLAIGGWLIHLAGAPTDWIVRRSGGLFFLTSAVNSATVIVAGLALILGAPGPHDFTRAMLPTLLVGAVTLAVVALPAVVRSRPRTPTWIRAISAGVQDAEDTTFHRPSWRLLGSLGYLWFDIAVLWLVLRGLGEAPSIAALILAYTVGYLANMLPIPGGIGVLDAGLAGALALYGVSPAHAAAAALVYHAIALWVPGVGGLIGYLRVRPRLVKPEARRRSACLPGSSRVSAATPRSRSASSPTASSNAVA